jgi:hypothetical protein
MSGIPHCDKKPLEPGVPFGGGEQQLITEGYHMLMCSGKRFLVYKIQT